MDEQKRPRAREKRIVNGGKGVEKQGEGIGSGPVNNMGNYEKRREQEAASAVPKTPLRSKPRGKPALRADFRTFRGMAAYRWGSGRLKTMG